MSNQLKTVTDMEDYITTSYFDTSHMEMKRRQFVIIDSFLLCRFFGCIGIHCRNRRLDSSSLITTELPVTLAIEIHFSRLPVHGARPVT